MPMGRNLYYEMVLLNDAISDMKKYLGDNEAIFCGYRLFPPVFKNTRSNTQIIQMSQFPKVP